MGEVDDVVGRGRGLSLIVWLGRWLGRGWWMRVGRRVGSRVGGEGWRGGLRVGGEFGESGGAAEFEFLLLHGESCCLSIGFWLIRRYGHGVGVRWCYEA